MVPVGSTDEALMEYRRGRAQTEPLVPRSVRLPADQLAWVDAHADEADTSFSWVVRQAIRQYQEATSHDQARLDVPGEPDLVKLVTDGHDASYWLEVDGYRVPHITVTRYGTADVGEDRYQLLLDGRFALDAPWGEVWRWAWFLANAMAISAGVTCHGPNGRLINPHGPSYSWFVAGPDGQTVVHPSTTVGP